MLFLSCQPNAETQTEAMPDDSCLLADQEEGNMNNIDLENLIPLIDASTPAEIETATFSLG